MRASFFLINNDGINVGLVILNKLALVKNNFTFLKFHNVRFGIKFFSHN